MVSACFCEVVESGKALKLIFADFSSELGCSSQLLETPHSALFQHVPAIFFQGSVYDHGVETVTFIDWPLCHLMPSGNC